MFQNHLFVSYAHTDNLPLPVAPTQPGWVTNLVEMLKYELRARLGTTNVTLWTDQQLHKNRPFDDEIMSAIRASALLMVVMSPSYVNSVWCLRERNEFLSLAKARVAQGHVFAVEAREVLIRDYPAEFARLDTLKFWRRASETAPDIQLGGLNATDRDFIDRIYELAYAMKKELERLAGAATPTGALAAPRVFVARATSDLRDRERRLRAYLEESGIAVLPTAWYPDTDRTALDAAITQDMQGCALFVQLLSENQGKNHLPRRQASIARRLRLKSLAWRAPESDPESVGDVDHRGLLKDARACLVGDFQQSVARLVQEPPPAAPRPVSAGKLAKVFFHAETRNTQLVRAARMALEKLHFDCYSPKPSATAAQARKEVEANLRNCSAIFLISDPSRVDWVHGQLKQARKVNGDEPRSKWVIFDGELPDVGRLGDGVVTRAWPAGPDDDDLESFADSVQV